MKPNRMRRRTLLACCLAVTLSLEWGTVAAAAERKLFSFDDEFVQIEAAPRTGASRAQVGIDVRLSPKPGWKLLADNSSGSKPLRLKFSMAACVKAKGGIRQSKPDVAGTDDSGAYSEYFTGTASLQQDFSWLKCSGKSGLDGTAALTYLLCQDNRCVGPFSREFRFRLPDQN